MTSPLDLELHDSLIKELNIDFRRKIVTLMIDFYPTDSTKIRSPLELTFSNVESMSGLYDFYSLDKNSFAGNISYWHPGDTTYIYLSDGCISIKSKNVTCKIFPPQN